MPRERDILPQLEPHAIVLTDGGLETTLVFHHGIELPDFAAFPLLDDPDGREVLRGYLRQAVRTAIDAGRPLSLDTPTWRANPDWAARLGYDAEALAAVDRAAIELVVELREEAAGAVPIVLCGVVGPRGDGYRAGERMTVEAARSYHRPQLTGFAESPLDYAAAVTISYPAEAAGIVLAARDAGIPVAIMFTVETDGALPSGDGLGDAIEWVDALTDGYASYFGVNCAHPSHLPAALAGDEPWTRRVHAFRANASRRSHAELDEADELDDGDPAELAREFAELRARVPQLTVLGGCCGTDDRHIRAIAAAVR